MADDGWRQKFTPDTTKVPLRRARLEESLYDELDEDSLLQTQVFQEAILSVPGLHVSPYIPFPTFGPTFAPSPPHLNRVLLFLGARA